jgi:hypothetical protein
MALLEPEAEHGLDHGAEADPLEPEEPACELGVEERVRAHADPCQAGEVLQGGVQHPLDVGEDGAEVGQVGAGDRIDDGGAGADPPQLDQVGPLAVAISGGTLRVDGDWSRSGRDCPDNGRQSVLVRHNVGETVARLEQRCRGQLVDLLCRAGHGSHRTTSPPQS